ncbi:MAG: 6-phosphogluconolactonase [Desulfatirhabdiaceae bacterium]
MTDFHGQLLVFENAADLTRQMTEQIRQLLGHSIRHRDRASLVVSGGTTPVALFEALSGADLPWEKVLISLADERWVDPGSPDSNEHLVRTHLLKNRAAAATFIGLKLPYGTAKENEVACSSRVRQIPIPVDILILGMGDDGHTASLFPGAAELSQAMYITSDRICMAIHPPAAPYDRITLTLPALLNSRQIFVHIVGEKKRQVYEMAISGESLEGMPIRAILGQKRAPVTIWWAP